MNSASTYAEEEPKSLFMEAHIANVELLATSAINDLILRCPGVHNQDLQEGKITVNAANSQDGDSRILYAMYSDGSILGNVQVNWKSGSVKIQRNYNE